MELEDHGVKKSWIIDMRRKTYIGSAITSSDSIRLLEFTACSLFLST